MKKAHSAGLRIKFWTKFEAKTYLLAYLLTCLLTNLLTYLLTPLFYGPLRAFVSLITEAPSSLSAAFCRHLLNFTSHRPHSTASNHLNLGIRLLVTSGLL
jgi:hypothetical protein